MAKKNIVLIGMPGSGKSTLGVQLAKYLGMDFIDTDLLIQSHQGQKLQTILETQGYQVLRDIEAQELLQLQLDNNLVATGGSAVYSQSAMEYLKQQAILVYLAVELDEIKRRINDEGSRGIARSADQSLADVYYERTPLYERYADIVIDNNRPAVMEAIIQQLYSTGLTGHYN